MITLYHNPRCSKSRQALALLEDAGIETRVHRYLDAPLDTDQLKALLDRLEGDHKALVRTNEAEWKSQSIDIDDPQAVIAAIVATPKLMQRPIADRGDRAVIGRPPETVLSLIATA
ncbi:arsenate reductase (glutaredoxin) [Halomonas sp. YLGW01]|uniref:arsenate reductase (glutaredoxin) n=1 Tax=Halomonas sp. YLGW01 TaxID=2773308 RepID=UPI00177EB258|nr:arsenate reductase (glutaredoxin) [Halomonas sp. YLGW01]